MTSTNTTRTVILSATDGSSASDDVLRTSGLLAGNVPQGELHLLYVLEPMTDRRGLNVLVPPMTEVVSEARTLLEKAAARTQEFFTGRIETHLAVGEPWREILQLSAHLNADLIVVGSHRRKGVERLLLGSVSEQVVRKASCQVLVARPKDYGAMAVPEIEPPCKHCVATQNASAGAKLWCVVHEHRHKHEHGRLHYEFPPTYGVGSMFIRPEQ